MPYDPRMMQQIAQMGVGMMGPQQGSPFVQVPSSRSNSYSADQPNDPSQSVNRPKQPPSLYDMMLSLGRMTRPEYDKAIRGPGPYGIAPKEAARLGPMGFLGNLGRGRGEPPR